MPSSTPPDKVLAAARKFAREKFALKHRYAMVLHTEQQHPASTWLSKPRARTVGGYTSTKRCCTTGAKTLLN
jgi:hypothetical protein